MSARVDPAATAVTAEDIRATYDTIGRYVRRTPVITVDLGDLTGTAHPAQTVCLKLEQLQCSGSFKTRGTFANLLLRELPDAGVVAASGGNHGVAVAHAAHRLGVPAKIFVPTVSAPAKIERIEQLGADLVVGGDRYADALAAAEAWTATSGALPVHAFDQRETLLGQGSIGLELAHQVSGLDTVLVPVGGGGLIAGIAAYLAGTVRVVGVDDDAIRHAQRTLWDVVRVVAEPAAAVGVAALLTGAYIPRIGERGAVVISGANTNAAS